MKRKVLIVEDDVSFGAMLQSWTRKRGYNVDWTLSVEQAKSSIVKTDYHLILSDLRLPDGDGIMLLAWINEQKRVPPVIIMTSYGEIQSAVSAIKMGAFDYLEKPINPSILKQKIEQALQQISKTSSSIKKKVEQASDMVYGKSKVAQKMYEHIRMVAPTRMSVLITGESGSGKEYAARMIHEMSKRKDFPFIAVDCGVLSRELAPSELFGHLKGSFTSAMSDKIGVFEQADGGTVFLDEVENLSYDVQVQLLRALQELKVRPVGSVNDIKVDVRIIVATNKNLNTAIKEGSFREDLFHRLNEFSLTVPPLRERSADIPVFVAHFLENANEELDKDIKGFSKEVLQILKQYHWSGNLRELRNVVRRAVLFAQKEEIITDNLPDYLLTVKQEPSLSLHPGNEKEQIENALRVARGNKSTAARLLQIDRKTLYNKMHQFEMDL